MSLGIKPGARIQIRAEGTDEYEALQGIEEFLKRNELTK
nr:HPr family phosphocarrier protein [Bacillus nakamurai]